MAATKQRTTNIPADLLNRLIERSEFLFDVYENLEDYFISRSPALTKKLREAREQHKKGNLIPFEDLKKRYV